MASTAPLLPALDPDAAAPAGGEGTSIGGIGSQLVHVFAENRLAIVGAVIIVASVLFCFVGPLVYHTNQSSTQNALLYSTQNAPPSSGHLLGTDQSGFDIFGRIMYGGQVSLEVGFAAAAIATLEPVRVSPGSLPPPAPVPAPL